MDRARTDFCHERKPSEALDACLAETKVHVVGHSQGGLDARWAITKLGYAPHTASLTTVGTPHRGTPLGDKGLALLDNPFADVIANAIFLAIGETRTRDELARDVDFHAAMFWLSRQRANDPAFDIPNADGVEYQSWAGIATLTGAAVAPSDCEGKMLGGKSARFDGLPDAMFVPLIPLFAGAADRPNDGHIPVESAKWGTFRGCLPADHLDLIGRPASQHDSLSPTTGFDHRVFYRVMARELADKGM
jgi:triacylglycerol lipase